MKSSPIADGVRERLSRLDVRSVELRRTILRMLEKGKRGHLISALSVVEILRVLFDDILRYNPHDPSWPQRDRFILSKGHGCMALYAILSEKGFFPESELWKFCRSDGIFGRPPRIPARSPVSRLRRDLSVTGYPSVSDSGLVRNTTVPTEGFSWWCGDGECDEGSIWEAALCAAKHRLDNLTVIIDYNKQQSYGTRSRGAGARAVRRQVAGIRVCRCGSGRAQRSVNCIRPLAPFPWPKADPARSSVIRSRGKGVGFVEGNLDWHHKSNAIKEDEVRLCHEGLESCR